MISLNGARKYIVDIVGDLPVILMELDQNEDIVKSYIYENSRIIAQRNGGQSANKYFYVNDRLGSVRQVIDMYGSVERNYTYSPFGQLLESGAAEGAPSNPFMFTGQWFDDEISQYYLRARMYDPVLMRFTSRDPVRGKFREPMTLHVYLYCLNDPINHTDPTGELIGLPGTSYIRAKMAAVHVGILGMVQRFVMTLNLQNAWLDFRLAMTDLRGIGIQGMISMHNAFSNVAYYGWKPLATVTGILGSWQGIDPGGPIEFPAALLGDPHPPTTLSGVAGLAIYELVEKLWEDRGDADPWEDVDRDNNAE